MGAVVQTLVMPVLVLPAARSMNGALVFLVPPLLGALSLAISDKVAVSMTVCVQLL